MLNYIRNSVKVVIDAYNGDVTYYMIDEKDPILKTYSKIFPDLFSSLDGMPADLNANIRHLFVAHLEDLAHDGRLCTRATVAELEKTTTRLLARGPLRNEFAQVHGHFLAALASTLFDTWISRPASLSHDYEQQ